MRILGIDPGSNATGFGVVEQQGSQVVHVAHGTLRPPRGTPLAQRLDHLHAGILAVVEQVFVAASPRAALVLGQARGAVLSAVGAAGIAVNEYSAAQVKQAVTGNGRAAKRQVQSMVRRLLELDRTPASDAADALALAIRHAHGGRLEAVGVTNAARRRPRRRVSLTVRRRW
jgi:crossover junction endodeoxyribonuclease RuvC